MDQQVLRALVVSEKGELAKRISRLFADGNPAVEWRKSPDQVLRLVKRDDYDVVILTSRASGDSLPENDRLVEAVTAVRPSTQILFLAEPDDIEEVVSTLKAGTYQYAKQPVSDEELKLLIKTAIEDRKQVHAVDDEPVEKNRLGNLMGRSPQMKTVFKQIKQAAEIDIPVLILGETGTGKDLAARIIHQRSARRDHPYLAINLGALPTELVASELFGHVKGAFSGAIQRHQGIFERAINGTVLLDEIDAINEKVRVSLLRLLEQKAFRRLGGSKLIRADIRIIAASNANLEEMAEEGEFRKDLFYRLDVFRITMPPLRQRPEDIPLLVNAFAQRFAREHELDIQGVSKEFMDVMQSYTWPGNVREVKNVVQRAILMCRSGALEPNHLPQRFKEIDPRPNQVTFEIGTPLEEIERTMVLRALEATHNNRKEAAKLLGISRRVIYNKLKKFDIS